MMTTPNNPIKYKGTDQYLVPMVTRNREPTGADVFQPETGRYYPVTCLWQVGPNPTTGIYGEIFILGSIQANVAYWHKVGSDSGFVETLTGDTGGPVPSDVNHNINILGTSGQITVTGNPLTNTLTLSLAGGGTAVDSFTVDAATPPGTNPVVPSGTGNVTVTGGQTAPGTITNVIQTNSLAANTWTTQIQQTSVAAAKTTTLNGVSHFNSGDFTNDEGFISVISSGFPFTYTNVTTTPYVVLSTDQYLSVNSAIAITIQLPNTTTTGRVIIVKDRTGQAATNNITVTTVGGVVLIDGSASHVMNVNYESRQFLWNGTTYEVF